MARLFREPSKLLCEVISAGRATSATAAKGAASVSTVRSRIATARMCTGPCLVLNHSGLRSLAI